MSKRLLFLEKITSEGSEDPIAWYGLALEYRSLERHDDALRTFETLRAKHPDYVPMYLMCGQLLETMSRPEDARAWYTVGVDAARKQGNSHALGELESALAGVS